MIKESFTVDHLEMLDIPDKPMNEIINKVVQKMKYKPTSYAVMGLQSYIESQVDSTIEKHKDQATESQLNLL